MLLRMARGPRRRLGTSGRRRQRRGGRFRHAAGAGVGNCGYRYAHHPRLWRPPPPCPRARPWRRRRRRRRRQLSAAAVVRRRGHGIYDDAIAAAAWRTDGIIGGAAAQDLGARVSRLSVAVRRIVTAAVLLQPVPQPRRAPSDAATSASSMSVVVDGERHSTWRVARCWQRRGGARHGPWCASGTRTRRPRGSQPRPRRQSVAASGGAARHCAEGAPGVLEAATLRRLVDLALEDGSTSVVDAAPSSPWSRAHRHRSREAEFSAPSGVCRRLVTGSRG